MDAATWAPGPGRSVTDSRQYVSEHDQPWNARGSGNRFTPGYGPDSETFLTCGGIRSRISLSRRRSILTGQLAEESKMPEQDTDVTEAVHREWRALLGVDTVRPEDDFFALGGDSVLAVELIERVEARLGIEFPVESLFFDGRLSEVLAGCSEAYLSRLRQT
ncbi:acyl carrier protein [Catenuloplanes atrovinosus]|uniref:Acyl carrier protein n=1 Tax=Catenuloplanes atrovinosus TaxID=137266 RepID=A0AAE3YLB4_9ACTN|nr:acyl carrier protein [Catenuloplanes atrovinosus]MDR7275600.1 acyl carrier protein [Catenuloplanes atrovinosus]